MPGNPEVTCKHSLCYERQESKKDMKSQTDTIVLGKLGLAHMDRDSFSSLGGNKGCLCATVSRMLLRWDGKSVTPGVSGICVYQRGVGYRGMFFACK